MNRLTLMAIITMFLLLTLSVTNAGGQIASPQSLYKPIRSKDTEKFVVPFNASNYERNNPLTYTFSRPLGQNWILNIQNNLSYAYRQDAKTVIKLLEPAPSEKFIEIAMFGNLSKRFWAAVNTKDSGYVRVYSKDSDGWFTGQPIIIAHANNQGLTITDGRRIIVDKLSLNGFTPGSVAIYGKDDPESPIDAYAGNILFDMVFGNPADSPIFYLPLGMLVGVGGLLIALLVFKRRNS
ncbi:MAG TPA: hypothetical protein VFJ05_00225 [Nitrososphaeraceae archaeon]|nr:hypothetical protein [Nitrososphaeraceae archaeon]